MPNEDDTTMFDSDKRKKADAFQEMMDHVDHAHQKFSDTMNKILTEEFEKWMR